jgi:signal transduction histidine kinase
VVSYNGAPGGLALFPQPELVEKVKTINTQLNERLSGEVTLSNGEKILVATADLPLPGWRVYVDQPANLTAKLFVENTFHSLWDVLLIVFVMAAFVVGVSYWVIIPITRPLERLRHVALALREKEDVVLTKDDLEIPNNEIGELASVFLETVEALHVRRQEVLSAQRQLSQVNQRLEKRVEDRTRELKHTSDELVKAERLAAIGQMASIISHEIRNPLAVISNATRLIKMLAKSPDPKLAKQIGIIEAEIKQANSIISEVLGYARTRELILSTIDVNSYLREILNSYPISRCIKLQMDLDVETVRIKVDAEEIKQALRNVISNAVEAMANGGTLTVGTRVGRRAVCIFVQDTGAGITEEIRRKMFSPFFTTKARGTGLGLAVVSKAIARHKGKLFIKSELGRGTSFQIYLKIYRKTGDTNYGEAS